LSCFLSASFSDFSCGVKIHQPPFIIGRRKDVFVMIHCEQDDSTYTYMYWYKQSSDGSMQMAAYSFGVGEGRLTGNSVNVKNQYARPSLLKFTLTAPLVEVTETAVYFCASSKAHCLKKHQQLNNN
uniref:Immunoglobulin V-set domain-containing protein n=1 Tax=Salarias fasciatus TaxID=181472 RepID=A0A672H9L6_SALFA